MELVIKSKVLGHDFIFRRSFSNGNQFVWVTSNPRLAPIQICENGTFRGVTIRCSQKDFEPVCRKWYRQHLRYKKKDR